MNDTWNDTSDWKIQWHETDDPRVLAIITYDEDATAPDYEAQAPALIGYEWGSRANFNTIGGKSEVPDAWIKAFKEDYDNEFADRFVSIFYGAKAIHLRSSVDQYTWAVVFRDPGWMTQVGCPEDAADDDLAGEVNAYIDGEVFGIGYAVMPERTTTETEVDKDLEGWDQNYTCWGFYGQKWAQESALSADSERPELPTMLRCAACGDRGILPNRERCDLCERYPSDEAAQEANPA